MSSSSPTQRFSSRVSDYIRARPTYPPAFLDFLRQDLGLRSSHTVADIGSGTGILTQLLLPLAQTVYAVEPNADTRRAAEQQLSSHPAFHSIDATAESTTLPDHGIDLLVAAQAFHWFDHPRAKQEFLRILKPNAPVVLVWNERLVDRPPFSVEYENLVQRYATDLDRVRHHTATTHDTPVIKEFFSPNPYRVASFPNHQDLDFDLVLARVTSSSYMPLATAPAYPPMRADLRRAFDAHQQGGTVRIDYDTRAYHGRLH
jgi:SAM-dependent methyltransferase